MTIASAFNDIAVAQGGTAAKSGAITAAIDALNDALAGSDQPAAKTIEQAVRLLGEHIGGGGGSSTAKVYIGSPMEVYAPSDFTVIDSGGSTVATSAGSITVTMGDVPFVVDGVSFDAVSGGLYTIQGNGKDINGPMLVNADGTEYPSLFDADSFILTITIPNIASAVLLSLE